MGAGTNFWTHFTTFQLMLGMSVYDGPDGTSFWTRFYHFSANIRIEYKPATDFLRVRR